MEPKKKHLEVLKKYFGHKSFRPAQWTVISSILHDRRDNCAVMATGSGKSLCFQFPAVFTGGISLVISPLISLMQDQVMALKMCNIPATLMAQGSETKYIKERVLNGEFRVIYASPEWITCDNGSAFLEELKEKELTLVAIDEAHCVSQWGMDFRTSYRKLRIIRDLIGPKTPIIAVTATATEAVVNDIVNLLKLRKPLLTKTSCDRPNLYLSASIKGEDIFLDIRNILYKDSLENKSFESSIVYCPTKKIADKVALVLNAGGLKCAVYHADLPMVVRKSVHKQFVMDELKIVVATVAFGMGIDKPDVRQVIHYGAPKDMESYYQEIGRAGRDGLPSLCHIFYKSSDFVSNQHFLSSLSGQYLAHKQKMMKLMEEYVVASGCRRKLIVSHFDPGAQVEQTARCCDNCSNKKLMGNLRELEYDMTDDAVLLLKAVHTMGGSYGLQMAIHLVRGSYNKRFPVQYQSSPLFGQGQDKCDEYWKLLGNVLMRADLIAKDFKSGYGWNKNKFPSYTIKTTENGFSYMNDVNFRKKVALKPTIEMIPFIKRFLPCYRSKGEWLYSSTTSSAGVESDILRKPKLEDMIYKELDSMRCRIASKMDCMPYMVLKNLTLQSLAQIRPSNLSELSSVDGLSDKQIESYGNECLSSIAKCVASFKSDDPLNKLPPNNVKRFTKKKNVLSYEAAPSCDESCQDTTDNESDFQDAEGFGSPTSVSSFRSAVENMESEKSLSDRLLSEDDDLFMNIDISQIEKRKRGESEEKTVFQGLLEDSAETEDSQKKRAKMAKEMSGDDFFSVESSSKTSDDDFLSFAESSPKRTSEERTLVPPENSIKSEKSRTNDMFQVEDDDFFNDLNLTQLEKPPIQPKTTKPSTNQQIRIQNDIKKNTLKKKIKL